MTLPALSSCAYVPLSFDLQGFLQDVLFQFLSLHVIKSLVSGSSEVCL